MVFSKDCDAQGVAILFAIEAKPVFLLFAASAI
jgi:hypothetical protein